MGLRSTSAHSSEAGVSRVRHEHIHVSAHCVWHSCVDGKLVIVLLGEATGTESVHSLENMGRRQRLLMVGQSGGGGGGGQRQRQRHQRQPLRSCAETVQPGARDIAGELLWGRQGASTEALRMQAEECLQFTPLSSPCGTNWQLRRTASLRLPLFKHVMSANGCSIFC